MKVDPESALKQLGQRIRSLRAQRKLTQQELGEAAGIAYKFLGEVERGRHNPSFRVLVSIAAALDVEMADLLRIKHEALSRDQAIRAIEDILIEIPDKEIRNLLMILQSMYPKDSGD
jgi:transcriptional regulator with XRE-family HTH domain